VNGQSLSQSGSAGLAGQHGMPSIALASESAATCSLAAACIGIAMTSRVIGASKRPTIAVKAKSRDRARDMANSIPMKPHYHISRRWRHQNRL
jgi:hypothetical protein